MTIDNVTGGIQGQSLQGSGEIPSDDTSHLINLPSYLSASDVNFSASNTGVLGIRLPVPDSSAKSEFLLALLENEQKLSFIQFMSSGILNGQISAALAQQLGVAESKQALLDQGFTEEEAEQQINALLQQYQEYANSLQGQKQSESIGVTVNAQDTEKRFMELMKAMMQGIPSTFWNESNRERTIKSEVSVQELDSGDKTLDNLAAFAASRGIQSEDADELDDFRIKSQNENSANAAFKELVAAIDKIIAILKAMIEVYGEPLPEPNVKNGKVMLSLT